jgi:hypothetical protein
MAGNRTEMPNNAGGIGLNQNNPLFFSVLSVILLPTKKGKKEKAERMMDFRFSKNERR